MSRRLSAAALTSVSGPCGGRLVGPKVKVSGPASAVARFRAAASRRRPAGGPQEEGQGRTTVRLVGYPSRSVRGDVVVAMDTPYVLGRSTARRARLATFGETPGAMSALVSVLLAGPPPPGTSPSRSRCPAPAADAGRLVPVRVGVVDGMEDVSDRYRRLAATLTARYRGGARTTLGEPDPLRAVDRPRPVGHLVDVHGRSRRWSAAAGRPPAGRGGPAGAWAAAREQMQADLDDPDRVAEEYDGGFGRSTFGASVDGFVDFDLVVHGWDLARATGQDDTIDPRDVQRVQGQVDAMGDVMRENGVIAARRPRPGRLPQDRLMNSLGRST